MGEHEELAQWLEGEARSCAAQFRDRITRAAALLREARPQPVPGWQPIDTAPHDGTEILASDYDAWAKQCRPADTGLVYSTGPAVDLVKANEAMRKFSREPWDLPPPTNTTHPIPTEPPTDD